jgi:hypothetical protein
MKKNRLGHYPWRKKIGFPEDGVTRRDLAPILLQAFGNVIYEFGWEIMGPQWKKHPAARKEFGLIPPEACFALANFLSNHFLNKMPEERITKKVFWEDFSILVLRFGHNYHTDHWFKDYVKFRADNPEFLPFLCRVAQTAKAKESPAIGDRMIFCVFWDQFLLPLRFWSDDAAVEFLNGAGLCFNLDKVRNTRHELGLKPVRPAVVKSYKQLPSAESSVQGKITVEINYAAAKHARASAMVKAFLDFLKAPQPPKL